MSEKKQNINGNELVTNVEFEDLKQLLEQTVCKKLNSNGFATTLNNNNNYICFELKGVDASPAINFYHFYHDIIQDPTMTVNKAIQIMYEAIEPTLRTPVNIQSKSFVNYNNIKDKMIINIMPTKNVKEDFIARPFAADLSEVIGIDISTNDLPAIAIISPYILEIWHKSKEELFTVAENNTRALPYICEEFNSIIKNMIKTQISLMISKTICMY